MDKSKNDSYTLNGITLYKHKGLFDVENYSNDISEEKLSLYNLASDIFKSENGEFDKEINNMYIHNETHNIYYKLIRGLNPEKNIENKTSRSTEKRYQYGLIVQLIDTLNFDFTYFLNKSAETKKESLILLKILYRYCKTEDKHILRLLKNPSMEYVKTLYGNPSINEIEELKEILLSFIVPIKKNTKGTVFIEEVEKYYQEKNLLWNKMESAYKKQCFNRETDIDKLKEINKQLLEILDFLKKETPSYENDGTVITNLYLAFEMYKVRCIHSDTIYLLQNFQPIFFPKKRKNLTLLDEKERIPLFFQYDNIELDPNKKNLKELLQNRYFRSIVIGCKSTPNEKELDTLEQIIKDFDGVWRTYKEYVPYTAPEEYHKKTTILSILQMLYFSRLYNLNFKTKNKQNINLKTIHTKYIIKPTMLKKNKALEKEFLEGNVPLDVFKENPVHKNCEGIKNLSCVIFTQLLYAKNYLPDDLFQYYVDGLITLQEIQLELCKFVDFKKFDEYSFASILKTAEITEDNDLIACIYDN